MSPNCYRLDLYHCLWNRRLPISIQYQIWHLRLSFYVEFQEDSDSSEYNAGTLSIISPLIPQSSAPVPAEVLLR
jgi:hypothetical protein